MFWKSCRTGSASFPVLLLIRNSRALPGCSIKRSCCDVYSERGALARLLLSLPLQVKHLTWKWLAWTRSTCPLQGSPHLKQWIILLPDEGLWRQPSWVCSTAITKAWSLMVSDIWIPLQNPRQRKNTHYNYWNNQLTLLTDCLIVSMVLFLTTRT